MKCEIIAVGSELLTPWRQDTNSLYLTERLNQIGVRISFKTIVGDRQHDLVSTIATGLRRSDILILMGGLGPTEDDLSREALAEALGVSLRRDGGLVAALSMRFAAMRRPMTDNNLKQCDVLPGSIVLANANGTAPGQWIDTGFEGHRKIILMLPGPPKELKPLFDSDCMPRLRGILPVRNIATRTLKATGIGESAADALLAPIYVTFTDVETTILAGHCEIQLQLTCAKRSMEAAQRRVNELASRLEEALDQYVFSSDGDSLEQIVVYYLELKQETLAVAESCTGGLLAQRITSISGSSRSFLGGAIVYSNDLKTAFTGVPPSLIQTHGAVSAQVAESMARGIRENTGATLGVAITGIAGPLGGTDEKPVGLVYVALSDAKRTFSEECHFRGDRENIRLWASQKALDLVRRRLM